MKLHKHLVSLILMACIGVVCITPIFADGGACSGLTGWDYIECNDSMANQGGMNGGREQAHIDYTFEPDSDDQTYSIGGEVNQFNWFGDSFSTVDKIKENAGEGFFLKIARFVYYLLYIVGTAFGAYKFVSSVISYYKIIGMSVSEFASQGQLQQCKGDIIEVVVGLVLFEVGMPLILLFAHMVGIDI